MTSVTPSIVPCMMKIGQRPAMYAYDGSRQSTLPTCYGSPLNIRIENRGRRQGRCMLDVPEESDSDSAVSSALWLSRGIRTSSP